MSDSDPGTGSTPAPDSTPDAETPASELHPDTADVRTAAVRALEAEFSELITHFRRLIMENANRVSPGMLPGAYKTFTTIARCGEVTASALSERMLVDKGQVSRSVRELEDLGLIERSPDPADGRSLLLRLTAHGETKLGEARQPQEGMLRRNLADWSVSDIDNLTRLLHALSSGVTPDGEA